MKVKTDPNTGATCALLSKSEREKLASAKSVLAQYGYLNEDTDAGDEARSCAESIGTLLAGEVTSPTGETGNPMEK